MGMGVTEWLIVLTVVGLIAFLIFREVLKSGRRSSVPETTGLVPALSNSNGDQLDSNVPKEHPIEIPASSFLAAPVWRLILLHVITLGFYDLYWNYKNWVAVKEREKRDISPALRAWFSPFFIISLFNSLAREVDSHLNFGVEAMGALYILSVVAGIVLNNLARFHDPADAITILVFAWACILGRLIPLVYYQKRINKFVRPSTVFLFDGTEFVIIAIGILIAVASFVNH